MNEHFLSYIEIQQFKCFNNFKAEGFKRVNLIAGKNNIGKTAFMEAIFINICSENIRSMISALIKVQANRETLNLLDKNFSDVSLLNTINYYEASSNVCNTFFCIDQDGWKTDYVFEINGNEQVRINHNEIEFNLTFFSDIYFLDNFGLSNNQLNTAFQEVQKQDREQELNRFIQYFDSTIEAFKVIGEKPQCKVNGKYQDIVEFGDGLKHYISIIVTLYACKEGYLFIDEIDNGIHYSQLDHLWELILNLSKQNNCQVFAATHSKEMIESFERVVKKLDEQAISFTTLVKNNQQEIKTITQNSEMLLYSISQQHEVR